MGRKLDLSALTDEEARHVWAVAQRDLDLRRKEEARLAAARAGSLDWFYGHVGARFKRFGSAKVVHSLRGRLRAPGSPEPSPGEGSADSGDEQGPEDGRDAATCTPALGSSQRRRLSIHGSDFQADSDDSTGSGGHFLGPDAVRAAGGGLQGPAETRCTEEAAPRGSGAPEETDAGSPGPPGPPCLPEEQTDGPSPATGPDAFPDLSLPEGSRPPIPGTPGPDVLGREQPSLGLPAEADTDQERSGAAHEAPPSPSSPQAHTAPAGQPTEADVEEAALKRKLEELTGLAGDQGPTSEEEEGPEGGPRPGGRPPTRDPTGAAPAASAAAGPPGRPEGGPRGPTLPGGTAAQRLRELEGRVAATASEVRRAESEVSDIESRIAALRAAGLTVAPSGRPQRKSSLPVFLPRLAGTLGQSRPDPGADPIPEGQVAAAPRLLRRKLSSPPKRQGAGQDPFERASAYRGSLTQRSPGGRTETGSPSFGKPVMTQRP